MRLFLLLPLLFSGCVLSDGRYVPVRSTYTDIDRAVDYEAENPVAPLRVYVGSDGAGARKANGIGGWYLAPNGSAVVK